MANPVGLNIPGNGAALQNPQPANNGERRDEHGNRVTTSTKKFRGERYEVETTEVEQGKLWRAARAIPALGGWVLSKVIGTQEDADDCLAKAKFWNSTDKVERRTRKLAFSSEESRREFGFDINSPREVQREVEKAKETGRERGQNHHHYVLLKNSYAIVIPDGKAEKAYVRDFWNRDSGKDFSNPDVLERVVQSFMLGYDAIVAGGGDGDATLIIDLDNKMIRSLSVRPGANQKLDSSSVPNARYIDIDGSVIDSMKAKWDPEKVDSKTPLHGEKIEGSGRKRRADEVDNDSDIDDDESDDDNDGISIPPPPVRSAASTATLEEIHTPRGAAPTNPNTDDKR